MTPWTTAFQVPLSMEFSRQEYWNRLPFPSPGDLLNPGIEPRSLVSPALAGRLAVITNRPLMCVVAHLQQRFISFNHQKKIFLAAGGGVSE